MKIAILNHNPHNFMGGTETYSRILIKIFLKEGWKVTEFSINNPDEKDAVFKKIKGVNQRQITEKKQIYMFQAHKNFKKIFNSKEFDLIINNTLTLNIKESFIKNSNIVNVQHMDWKTYSFRASRSWFNYFNYVFLRLGYKKNLLRSQNVVFFNKLENHWNAKKSFYIPLPLDSKKIKYNLDFGNRKYIFWCGRFNDKQKGLSHLNKIYKLSKQKQLFKIAGAGIDEKKIKLPNEHNLGKLKHDEVIGNFKRSKLFILTSNYEGFPFIVSEALSQGVPVIMFDSFTSARFFGECDAVKLVKHKNINDFNKEIDKIISLPDKEWNELSIKAIQFSKNKLSMNNFKNKWLNIAKSFIKK